MARVGRPPSCTCGECRKCKKAAYMRRWWARQSPEKKRAMLDRRVELNGDAIRERDRQRYQEGRRPGPREPLKAEAQRQVSYALRRGELVSEPCEVCGAEPAQAHHDDYERPLDVRWLCRRHHSEVHRKYPTEATA